MSNDAKEQLEEFISEGVSIRWQLPTRPDLEKDCIDYVWDKWDKEVSYRDETYLTFLFIKFLSNHCSDAVSSQDINYMAKQQRGNDIYESNIN